MLRTTSFMCRKIFFAMLFIAFISCKKEKINNEDQFVEQTEALSTLEVTVSSAGQQFLELQWTSVKNTHFKLINYSIFLDNVKIVDGLTVTKYSLIDLKPGQLYEIKVIAATADGNKVEQTISGKTLEPVNTGKIYAEYNIHSFSMMTGGTSLQRLADGGHVVTRFLSHSAHFGGENTKLIVFRVDKNGSMLWYRLLSTDALKINSENELIIALHDEDKEAILLVGGFAIKLNVTTGELISSKDYSSQFANQSFRTAIYTASKELIAGVTGGGLLAINPTDLTVSWYQANTNRPGTIATIAVDSKKNIYYIFRSKNDTYPQIRVDKCDPTGNFITSFVFDGVLPNEYNWGFWMTALVVDTQDNLYLFGHNSAYNYLRYFKFTANGTLLKKNTTSDDFLAKFAFINGKGEIVVAGAIDGALFNTYGTVYVFDKDLNIKSKDTYSTLPFHIIRAITGNPDGSYNIFLNYMQTYTYENLNFVFIKTDINGKI